ncbi:DUF4815 domain-containing protein [Devosia ginsengisoli]|uniref:DUF4815 domain-containing protein n=1 Tax=Devosia ginsengisoli TaxID=400770 RepID=UPI0026E95631|nr:DUF4815 domain-containing protein [Devosia ginsengisoli]MCR6673228.1 DUF4815 domain-containing protein [Devosia ginsengisoli]
MYEHESGLPAAYDRARGVQEQQAVVFYGERALIQGAELNDLQSIIRGRHDRLGRLIAKDGDRTEGAMAVVDVDAETVTLTAGKIFVAGDEFPVAEKVIAGVAMTGVVSIGVRLVREWITADDDASLRGLVPGSLAEGEDGAAREVAHIAWALADDSAEGEFHQVYLLQDGTIIDQTPPPMLNGIQQAIAIYDRPHGHYIVSGNRVTALGPSGGKQHFSIEEGEANISGFKNVRFAALRIAETEDWDVAAVPGETHTYSGGASQTITTDFAPIDEITSILLTKEKTVSVTRGVLSNGIDGLPDSSVIEIVEVTQGGTTYVESTDFVRTGNGVDWAPTGAEPLSGSSYQVKYRYRASVTADTFDDATITVSGGATGGDIILAYTYKLPRIDIIGLLPNGAPAYIYGVSAITNPVMPVPPADVLPLCEVHNNWTGLPAIVVDGERTGVRMPTWAEVRRVFNLVEDQSRLIQLERLRSEVDRRDPTAKKNMFVDPFETDYYRDQGEAQTAAIGNRLMQLAIEPTFYDTDLTGPVTLDWVEEVLVEQALKTGCEKINPYQNFIPMPGKLTLTPAADFWSERDTQWTSPATLEFQRGINWSGARVTEETTVSKVGQRNDELPFLRQRSVAFTIAGFGVGEILDALTFDGLDVMPGGLDPADVDGEISGTFTIPANVPAGTKKVLATGQGGTVAEALFTGQGTLTVDVMRRTTTINRWSEPPRQSSSEGGGGDSMFSFQTSSDPQAQIFLLPATRQLVGVDFHLCHIGDESNHILIHQVAVDTGLPTTRLEAEAFVSMMGAVTGWKSGRYDLPVTTGNDRDHAFVIKTDDGDHSISLAALGGFDATLQKPVTSHPYPIGPRLSSVNARTWTAHQNEALSFRLVAARYPVTTKTVELGSFDLVDCSDMQVRAAVELPSAACSVVFEIERPGGAIYRLLPYQVLQLGEYLTETVELRAILTGTEHLSPILYAPVEFIAGEIATEATYVSRAFDFSTADSISAYLKLSLPGGSTAAVQYDLADDDWTELPLHATEISPDPAWVERNYREDSLSASLMRLKITLTGGPGARPLAADLGAAMK